jgi:two-component system, NtrC family, nitrogen regulation sensor histidine kinase GlnL
MTMASAILAATPATPLGLSWALGGVVLFVSLLVGAYLFSFALRRMLGGGKSNSSGDLTAKTPSSDSPAAFMTASMQAVIHKLREQEKELAALHQREREHAQQTERLSEAVTRNMPAGLLLISSAGLITSANPAAEAALGVRGLGYRRYSELLGDQSQLAKLLTACLQEGHTFRREEIEHTTASGELRQLGVTISPILNNSATVTGALCLLSDLTELAALQRQVQVKESLAALGELSAGIAHEFKNALATISGYAQMIRSETQGDTRENSQRILEQTRALAHVVTEFLKFARPLELSNEEVAVGPLIGNVISEITDAMPSVEISTSGEFELVSGDEALLRQALLNLVRNAAEAAGSQPYEARVRLHGSVERNAGHSVQRISVADNGPGIAASDLTKIFAPFYTTKSNGTGLGLAIVQKIVLQHGGTVEARNQTEGGAEFIVWLPRSNQHSDAVASVPAGI